MFLKYLVATLCCACVHAQLEPTESYTHQATPRSDNMKLYWNFNDTDITFEVHGKTTGWVGIGFSPNGAMTGADMFVGWVKDGYAYVTDRHGVGNTFPPKDPEQNIDVLAGKECDGWTMFKFTRQLAACETDKDWKITSSTQRLIYAYGDTDPTGDDITPANYHGTTNRGVESMYFLEPVRKTDNSEENTEYFDVLNNNFQIPVQETYYNCKLHKIPTLTDKRHVIRIEPIIQKGNEMYVHHIIVYQCGDVLQNPDELNRNERCYSPNMQHFATCTTMIAGWAVGGGKFHYPKQAGFPIGRPGDPVFVQIETHYDNQMKRSGIVDNSGLRFVYTSNLRQYDSGLITVGNLVTPAHHFIPPKAESFLNVAHCPQNCTKHRMKAANVNKLHIFGILLHSHLAGRKLKLRHFRNDEELPHISKDDAYDFNYQEVRSVDPVVEFIGDTDYMRMECVYNTEDRTEMVEGGQSTYNEMCLAFIFYYPRIDMSVCVTQPSVFETYPYFKILNTIKLDESKRFREDSLRNYNVTAPSPPQLIGKTVMEVMSSYDWTEKNIDKFSEDVLNMMQVSFCAARNRSDVIKGPVRYPTIKSVYTREQKQCMSRSNLQQRVKADSASTLTSNLFLLVTIHVFISIFLV